MTKKEEEEEDEETNVYMFLRHTMSYLGFRGNFPKRLEVLEGSRFFQAQLKLLITLDFYFGNEVSLVY